MLKKLSEAFGVSGNEARIKELISAEIINSSTEITEDKMGNLIAKKIINNAYPTIVISAHMDEVGFIITDITDDGYLKFDTIGDIKPIDIISNRVKIGGVTGIISLKAIHLTTKEEREKPIKISDLFIDIGARDKQDAQKFVEVGDYCCFDTRFSDFGENSICGKALGPRVGCFLLTKLLNELECDKYNYICLFTVQKEVSSRGCITLYNTLKDTDCIITIDSISQDIDKNIIINKGAVLESVARDTNKSTALIGKLIDYLELKNIGYQRAITKKGDLAAFKSVCADVPSFGIGIPTKYINTKTEIMEKNDIESAYNIICDILTEGKLWN